MSFHSRLFLFVFLPVTLAILQLLERWHKPDGAKIWLIFASLVFYGVGDLAHLPLFVSSITANYLFGWLFHASTVRSKRGWGLSVMLLGLFWNLGLLSYFKYWAFLRSLFHPLMGAPRDLLPLVLPLGISFYTFTQLMFLIDSYGGLIEAPYRFIDYVLFAAFFPYTLAGPLVKHEEIIPQFKQGVVSPPIRNVLFGWLLFSLGLFKKAALADRLGAMADPIFELARQGHSLSRFGAWTGSIAFALQLYFDFSGYSDMAVGLGHLCGIELPYNFNSPFKADNMIDFWKRWHMTLTRFLTNYVYNPMVLPLTRQRIMNGQSTIRPGKEDLSAFLTLLAVPTLVTMLVAGIWHGAGWTFICFGLLHGICIVFNHACHILRRRGFAGVVSLPRALNCLATCLAVMVSFIFFRAADLRAVKIFLLGLMGWNQDPLSDGAPWPIPVIVLGALLLAVWFLPNSQELCAMALSDSSFQTPEKKPG